VAHTECTLTGNGTREGEGETESPCLVESLPWPPAAMTRYCLPLGCRSWEWLGLRREFEGPEFGAGVGIERVNFVVHCAAEKTRPPAERGTAESDGSGVLVGNE